MTGVARRISFCTPESEVNVVDPVKFNARYAVIIGSTRRLETVIHKLEGIHAISEKAHNMPRSQPFQTKDLPGIQGRRI